MERCAHKTPPLSGGVLTLGRSSTGKAMKFFYLKFTPSNTAEPR